MTKATVVGLQGELGSGKTFFTQKFGEIAGVKERIASPTFVLMKIYDIAWCGYHKFIHIDAYRIEDEKELLNLGWESLLNDPKNLIFVEWPERVAGIMPENSKIIEFKHVL